jgi:hypothetical protein
MLSLVMFVLKKASLGKLKADEKRGRGNISSAGTAEATSSGKGLADQNCLLVFLNIRITY